MHCGRALRAIMCQDQSWLLKAEILSEWFHHRQWVLMEVAVEKTKTKSAAGSEAGIEVAASELSAACGTSLVIISYISLKAIFFLPSLLHQTQNSNKKWMP